MKNTKQTKKQPLKGVSATSVAAVEEPIKTTPVRAAEKRQEKSILKPFFFFAVFVALVGGAVLYPYLTEPVRRPVMLPQAPYLPVVQDVAPIVPTVCDCPSVVEDKSVVDALKSTIHDLEMENLNLTEKMNAVEDTTPALIELLRNIYTGRPFAKQLATILRQDKTNAFALEIQNQIGGLAIKGIPTDEQVQNLFAARFKMALDSYYVTRTQQTWWQQTKAFVTSLVRVYPENLSAQNAQGVAWLYLAKKQVNNNDFAGALDSVRHLPDHSGAFFADFMKAADQRILTNRIINAYFQGKEK